MKTEQLERIKHGAGFIAALDQSGGSTPKALRDYGIETSEYHTEDEMYDLIGRMRSRIIESKAFSSNHILGAILFEKTMERKIDNLYTADYLWEKKGIVPFLKIDNGLDEEKDGVQLMKPIPKLDELLNRATAKNIFGTKMRSVIHEANGVGIHAIVEQQFELGQKISDAGFVPILEPEVDIHSSSKQEAEQMLITEMISHLKKLDDSMKIMLKVSIPSVAGIYNGLMNDSRVARIVALSGGYSRKEACERLRLNTKLIASFSRALLSDLSVNQTQQEFDAVLLKTIIEIYEASL
ncbi:MAG: fructose bisphosphate aldolase [Velocimicrobium sp.]